MAAMTNLATVGGQLRGAVAFPRRHGATAHDLASQDALTEKLAAILGLSYWQNYQPDVSAIVNDVYYVPAHTLVRSRLPEATDAYIQAIVDDFHLFGGVVPYEFVATKSITHSLLHDGSVAPEGWSREFGREVASDTLAGFTVFTISEARIAGARLLALGPARIKPVQASGGRGQTVVHNLRQLDEALAQQDDSELARWGLVLEEHLSNVETLSVGQVCIDGLTTSYVGTQSLTPDNEEQLVYGGSTLLCVRGSYDELLKLRLAQRYRQAVCTARHYDAAAQRCWPDLLASRRNYDVALGTNAQGLTRMGVLEQSWRAGGASFAEACALQAFQNSEQLLAVQAATFERYGASFEAPAHAQVVYRGDDPATGFITKYGLIEPYGNPQ